MFHFFNVTLSTIFRWGGHFTYMFKKFLPAYNTDKNYFFKSTEIFQSYDHKCTAAILRFTVYIDFSGRRTAEWKLQHEEVSTFGGGEDCFLHLASLQLFLSTCQRKRIIVIAVIRLVIIIISTSINTTQSLIYQLTRNTNYTLDTHTYISLCTRNISSFTSGACTSSRVLY